ncbi:HPP family protein [Halalkalibacter urbisdiaboli]|nr:HPP family protein [Halalkalibacter urbisdiaboli]
MGLLWEDSLYDWNHLSGRNVMVMTKTVHPPAVATVIVAINTQAGWSALL